MANSFKSQAKVDKAVYFAFKESAGIADKCDWQTEKFSATENLGQTVAFRRPNQIIGNVTTIDPRAYDLPGTMVPANFKSHVEPFVNLTVDTKVEAPLQFSLEDMTFNVDKDEVYERSIKPAIASIRDQINALMINKLDLVTGNSIYGASITTGSTGDEWLANTYEANSLLVSRGIPESEMRKSVIMSPKSVSKLAVKQATIFNAPGADDVYRNGMLGKYAGFDFYSSGLLGAKVTNATATVDITAITLPTTWQPTFSFTADVAVATLKAGTKITFANSGTVVNWVHPSTKADTGYAAQFVVQEDVAVGTGVTVTVAECAVAAGDFQNISAAITASSTVALINGGTTRPSYAFYDKAIVAASPIIKIPSTSKGRIINLDGFNLAIIEDHWPGTTQSITKLVGYVGMAVVRPEAVVAMY